MAFQYVPISPELRNTLETIFSEAFMQENTNFPDFERFQFSSAVFVNWKSDIMVYDEEVMNNFVKESTRFSTWDEMVQTAADQAFAKRGRLTGKKHATASETADIQFPEEE